MEPEELRSLVFIMAVAVASPFIADVARRWTRLPAVVVEIGLGVLIGPYVLGLVEPDDIVVFLAELGLVFLIFLAGFEVDPVAVKGRPIKLAVGGWCLSLAIAVTAATVLHALDVTSGIRFVAICLTTTAIGTLFPILGDAGILPTRLGTNILASGVAGEIGPIIAISLALTTDDPARTMLVLIAFASITLFAGWVATRPARPRTVTLISRTLHTSGQLGVRIAVLLCLLLAWIASEFDLDILLGAFAAGMVARIFFTGHQGDTGESNWSNHTEIQHGIESVGFGFLIPLFFVVSGIRFDLDSLLDPVELLKVPMFLALMLLARGVPALLYRRDLAPNDVKALGLLQAAGLPLIVVITTIGVANGQMRPDNAAGLVGAGLLSVVLFPILALALRSKADESADHDDLTAARTRPE